MTDELPAYPRLPARACVVRPNLHVWGHGRAAAIAVFIREPTDPLSIVPWPSAPSPAIPTALYCRLERRLLRNVRYYTDYCLTHEDAAYMAQRYDVRPEQRDNYFVRTYDGKDADKIEMSFNLSTYQPHLKVVGSSHDWSSILMIISSYNCTQKRLLDELITVPVARKGTKQRLWVPAFYGRAGQLSSYLALQSALPLRCCPPPLSCRRQGWMCTRPTTWTPTRRPCGRTARCNDDSYNDPYIHKLADRAAPATEAVPERMHSACG